MLRKLSKFGSNAVARSLNRVRPSVGSSSTRLSRRNLQSVAEMREIYDPRKDNVPTAYSEFFQTGEVSVRGALNLVLYQEFERDENIVLMGEEVAEYNGAYKISKGLWKKHGDSRVIDTPITEMGFTGVGIGAALNGLRPIVEFMSFNFSMQAIDQIVNSAGKLHYMSGGKIVVPICFRGCNGAAKAVAAQHSQDFSSWYSSVPGLKVFTIYDHIDAMECFRTCIRDNDPCVMLENEIMYGSKFPVDESFFTNQDEAQIGKIRVMQEGSDITLISNSRMLGFTLEAAKVLEQEDGVSVEVLNNRCLRPMDRDSIIASAKKTHRVVNIEEGWPQCGVGAEIAATLMESDAFDYLDAPMERVCAIDVPMPYCPNLEEMVLPSSADIVSAARRTLKGRK